MLRTDEEKLELDMYPVLYRAISKNNYLVAKYILENNPKTSFLRPDNQSQSLLGYAYIKKSSLSFQGILHPIDKRMFYLLLCKLDVNEKTTLERSILHVAIKNNAPILDIVLLLMRGVDPLLADAEGKKAIDYLNESHENAEHCRGLLEQGLEYLDQLKNHDLLKALVKELEEDKDYCPEVEDFYSALLKKTKIDNLSVDDLNDFFAQLISLPVQVHASRMAAVWGDPVDIIGWMNNNKFKLIPDILASDIFDSLLFELHKHHYVMMQQDKHRQAVLEFKALYNVDCEIIAESKSSGMVFSLTEEGYSQFLKQYNHTIDYMPFTFEKINQDQWTFAVSHLVYKNIIQKNIDNLSAIEDILSGYKEHLHTNPVGHIAELRKFVLSTRAKQNKIDELNSLLGLTACKSVDETTAEKMIAFRAALPESSKKLKANRDEWPWWVLKVIATILSLGTAHFYGNIWQVNGADRVNEVENHFRPSR